MATSDKLLERLVKRVNESGVLLDVTLNVNGSTVTGRIAPQSAWFTAASKGLAGLEGDAAIFAEDFIGEGQAMSTEDYLHLSGGKMIFGREVPVPENGGLMRIPLTSIDGWMIGRLDVGPTK
jgi:hypothetical protein